MARPGSAGFVDVPRKSGNWLSQNRLPLSQAMRAGILDIGFPDSSIGRASGC